MDDRLAGRHALICGASRGIGRATAVALAQAGARLTVLARDAAALAALVAELPPPAGGSAHAVLALDGSDLPALEAAMAALAATGPVHVLVNNSGGPPPGAVAAAAPEDFAAAMRAHLLANQIRARALLPGMRAAAWGRIINVLSISVRAPLPGLGVSNATRAAVASWAKTLAGEVAAAGITVNNVLPGYTETDRIRRLVATRAAAAGRSEDAVRAELVATIPLGRFVQPEETAAAIAFLASPAAAAITGVSLPVDGGSTHCL